jgi:hypothetical protein
VPEDTSFTVMAQHLINFADDVVVSLAHSSGVRGPVRGFWSPFMSHLGCLSIDSQSILLLLLCFVWSDSPAELGARAHPLNDTDLSKPNDNERNPPLPFFTPISTF